MTFEEKAGKLAEIEKKIYQMSGSVSSNSQPSGTQESSLVPVLIPAVVAVVAFAASQFVEPEGVIKIGCWVVGILALGKTYMNWKQRSYKQGNHQRKQETATALSQLMQQRKSLITELNGMKKAGDHNRYWWETGVLPSERNRWQTALKKSQWKFGIFDEIKIEPRADGLYCRDFANEITVCSRKQAEYLMKSNDFCELYHDDGAWRRETQKFICRYVYAYSAEQLEEITSSTTRVRIDKEGEMRKYQQKLDEWERLENWQDLGTYETNKDLRDYNKINEETYRNWSHDRNWLEYWKQQDINKKPDYEEDTVYHQKFDNLYMMSFVPCAMILVSVEGDRVTRTASVFLPRKMQNSIEFTMRAESREHPSSGYLESYLEFEPLVVGGTKIKPDIKMVADYLFTEQKEYKFGKRNVLESKPRGLTDEEWCYLIWMDH